MPTTINYKPGLDLPRGRPVANVLNGSGNSTNTFYYWASDMRGKNYRTPICYSVGSSNQMVAYNCLQDLFYVQSSVAFSDSGSPAMTGQCYAQVLTPSQGPSGTLSTGNTTTSVVLSTALPAAVLRNQLANRGDGTGFIIRIIGNSAGGSGKTEERRIIANTSGTTPTVWLNEEFSFTPASGDRYELLSGRLYVASASTASGSWKFIDLATQSVSAALSVTNKPSISMSLGNTSPMISLDESYVPYNRNPGEGFLVGAATYDAGSANWVKSCLTATATAAGTITGQASAGDASVLANEYRNFQIRIVEDTTTPTAVGQRRRITSHTAGASAVYTLASNWTVTPSATAKFVIENDNDKIICFLSGHATGVVYNWNITAGTWDTTTWAARGSGKAPVNAQAYQAFSIVPDIGKNVRQSFIYSFRGGSSYFTSNTYDILDIAGGTNGAWITDIQNTRVLPYLDASRTAWGPQVPWTQEGKYLYISNINGTNAGTQSGLFRFNMITGDWEAYCSEVLAAPNASWSGIGVAGFANYYLDGSTYVPSVFFPQFRNNSGQFCQYPILA